MTIKTHHSGAAICLLRELRLSGDCGCDCQHFAFSPETRSFPGVLPEIPFGVGPLRKPRIKWLTVNLYLLQI